MLLELKVSNFAIIENLHIQFKKGLNILSGETGAGKSVLLKSLSLLMGYKSSTESIRNGCTQASIEGSFDLSKRKDIKTKLIEQGILVEDDTLVVRRVLSEDKSRVYLNGSLSTLTSLREVVSPLIEVAGHSAPLIELTGQHENRSLLSKAYHMDLLDQYTGTWELRQKFSEKYNRLTEIEKQIETLLRENQNKSQRLDFLIFQRDEIAALELSTGEDQNLETELKKLKSSSRLGQFVETVETVLYSDDDSALTRLQSIIVRTNEMRAIDPFIAEKLENLAQSKSLIEDCIYDLRTYVSKIEADPQKLEALEQRLSDLRKLQKKFGPTVDEILKALTDITAEIDILQNSEEKIEELKAEAALLTKDVLKLALDLHKKREGGSKTLATSVNKELLDLNMKGVTFHVAIEKLASPNSSGISDIEFMSQASSKDLLRPLAKFASGGELSRILLSLKRVVGTSLHPRTYLFDEVDTGVSGPTAEKVGKKLKSIAQGQQVICITHLPQVAACGDAHFFIQKSPQKASVTMEVSELKQKDRVQEIARLISGEKISKTSLAHAEQLLNEAH